MNNNRYLPLISLVLFVAFLAFSGCKKDCDPECVNGTCTDETCICDSGYSGADCSVLDDSCQVKNCVNGSCVNGGCECDSTYEGNLCDKRKTAKFAGSYSGADSCNSSNPTYSTDIVESTTDLMRFSFTNLHDIVNSGANQNLIADLDSTGINFSIPPQNVLGNTYYGSGSIETATGVITVTLSISGPGNDNCTATLTPQ